MSVFFNGQQLVTPTTASAVNDDAMQDQNLTVGNALALIGKSTGGKPKTVLSFGDPKSAKDVLRGGELLDAVLKAFAPSAQTGAPSVVRVVRVNPALQSTLALKNASNATVINLSSANYGLEDNKIKVKIETGSASGKRLTLQYGQQTYSKDNISRGAFSVTYTGAEVTATLAVTGTSVVLAAPAGTVVSTIDLNQVASVGDLVDFINGVSGFSAVVLENSSTTPALNALDYVSTTSVKSTVVNVRADLQAIVDWLNSGSQPLVTAARAASVGTLPSNIGFTFLTSGSDGTTINSDWSDAFSVLQAADVQWIAPISGDPAIHAMADTHAQFCSNTLRKERRAICGTVSGTSDVAAIAAAKLLNSDRTSLVHIGHYEYNSAGALTLRAPYMTAALIAAAFAGSNPGTPLTNKSLSVRGLERDLLRPVDTDPLILGGVLAVENTEEGYKVVQSISTWQADRKYNRIEQSVGAAVDFTMRNVRNALDPLRGQKSNPLLLSRAASTTETILRELARQEPEGPGVLAGDKAHPAYRNITATAEGDVVRVQFECSPVLPANFILVTTYLVPYSGTVTV